MKNKKCTYSYLHVYDGHGSLPRHKCLTIDTLTTTSLRLSITELPTFFTSYVVPARFTPSVTLTCNTVTSSGHVAVFTASVVAIFTVISDFTS